MKRFAAAFLVLALVSAGCGAINYQDDRTLKVIAASNAFASLGCKVVKGEIKPGEAVMAAQAMRVVKEIVDREQDPAQLAEALNFLVGNDQQIFVADIANVVIGVVAFVPDEYRDTLGVGLAKNAMNICSNILNPQGGGEA